MQRTAHTIAPPRRTPPHDLLGLSMCRARRPIGHEPTRRHLVGVVDASSAAPQELDGRDAGRGTNLPDALVRATDASNRARPQEVSPASRAYPARLARAADAKAPSGPDTLTSTTSRPSRPLPFRATPGSTLGPRRDGCATA